MGVVAFASVRSCGVTTAALALAATWPPERRVLLVEADPAGGTLAAASGWAAEPSLVSLAAAARRGGDPELVWAHCQTLPGGAAVLASPPSPSHARPALGMLAGLFDHLGELDADVLVDLGRLAPETPIAPTPARMVLMVRPKLADLQALAVWLEDGSERTSLKGLVVVGDGGYPDDEIATALGVEVLGRLPWDPDAATSLVTTPASARRLRVAPLVRAARTLGDRLVATLRGGSSQHDPIEPKGKSPSPAAPPRRVLRSWRPADTDSAKNGSMPEQVPS